MQLFVYHHTNPTEINKHAQNKHNMITSSMHTNKTRHLITHTHTTTPSTHLDEEHEWGEAVYLSKPSPPKKNP